MRFRIQVMRIKNKQGNDAATDSRIGKVKNRAEENKVITSHKRHPIRPVGIDNREVEHIDHLATSRNIPAPVEPTKQSANACSR